MTEYQGWNISALGSVAELIMGQSPDSKYYSEVECGLPFLQGCMEFQARYPKHVIYCSQEKKVARTGSILFSVRAPVGKMNIADRNYIIGRGLAAIKGTRLHQTYLEHYLCHEESRFRIASQGSTFEAINSSELSHWPINYPVNICEQATIAEVLSTADRAIEQTEALIAKQQRIKTGLMQDLLTRGIDEDGNLRSEETHAFKDSPLGRIPVEWEVVTIDQIASITTGDKDTQDAEGSGEYPFFVRSQTIERINSFSYDGEAVLTAGDGVGVGKVFHYFNGQFDFHQRVYCIHSYVSDMLGYYFYNYFKMRFMSLVTQFSAKGSVDSVRMEMIAKMLIPKPTRSEQTKASDILRKIETLIDKNIATLHKLRSLKIALMQDLLTGKVRVFPILDKTKGVI